MANKGKVDPLLGDGLGLLKRLNMRTVMPLDPKLKLTWKKCLKGRLVKEHVGRLRSLKAHGVAMVQDRSDALLLRSLGDGLGQARALEIAFPDHRLRKQLHKLKLGGMKFTRVALGQRLQANSSWKKLSSQGKKELLECPCGLGKQSAAHVWEKCLPARSLLDKGLLVDSSVAGAANWNALDLNSKLQSILAPNKMVGSATALGFKAMLASRLVKSVHSLEKELGSTVASFKDSVASKLLEEQVPLNCNNCWISCESISVIGGTM